MDRRIPYSPLGVRAGFHHDCRASCAAATGTGSCDATFRNRPDALHGRLCVHHSRCGQSPGTLRVLRGTVIYNARQPELSSVSVIIEAASINTDMSFRDDHLRSTDFFAVKQFPTIEFVSDRVTPTNGGAIVSGTLTMHGVSKRVGLPATLLMSPRLVGTTPNVAFAAVLTLSRKDFGIAGTNQYNPDYNPLTTMLSDSVAVLLELSGNRDSFHRPHVGEGHTTGRGRYDQSPPAGERDRCRRRELSPNARGALVELRFERGSTRWTRPPARGTGQPLRRPRSACAERRRVSRDEWCAGILGRDATARQQRQWGARDVSARARVLADQHQRPRDGSAPRIAFTVKAGRRWRSA